MLWYRMCYVPLPKNASVEILCAFCDNGAPAIVLGLKNLLRLHPKISFCAKQNAHHFNPIYILRSIYITRFPSGTCLGEWRKNELKNIQHAIGIIRV